VGIFTAGQLPCFSGDSKKKKVALYHSPTMPSDISC